MVPLDLDTLRDFAINQGVVINNIDNRNDCFVLCIGDGICVSSNGFVELSDKDKPKWLKLFTDYQKFMEVVDAV